MAKARVLSCAFAGITFFGCSDSGQETSSQTEEQIQDDDGVNILTNVFPSSKEKNPYSVENMNKAFKSLVLENNPNAEDIPELEANFLYVRFLPRGKQGAHKLKTYDTSMVLFKHPMDYNEIRKPAVYMDKTLPDSIVPYFASVPVGIGNPNGDWWSTAEYDDSSAYRFDLYYSGDKAGWEDVSGNREHDKTSLFSIRCLKD